MATRDGCNTPYCSFAKTIAKLELTRNTDHVLYNCVQVTNTAWPYDTALGYSLLLKQIMTMTPGPTHDVFNLYHRMDACDVIYSYYSEQITNHIEFIV